MIKTMTFVVQKKERIMPISNALRVLFLIVCVFIIGIIQIYSQGIVIDDQQEIENAINEVHKKMQLAAGRSRFTL